MSRTLYKDCDYSQRVSYEFVRRWLTEHSVLSVRLVGNYGSDISLKWQLSSFISVTMNKWWHFRFTQWWDFVFQIVEVRSIPQAFLSAYIRCRPRVRYLWPAYRVYFFHTDVFKWWLSAILRTSVSASRRSADCGWWLPTRKHFMSDRVIRVHTI